LLYGVEKKVIGWLRISLGLEALSVTSESGQRLEATLEGSAIYAMPKQQNIACA
jgi:hypothetical protein